MDVLIIKCISCETIIGKLEKQIIKRDAVESMFFKCDCGNSEMNFILNDELTDFTSIQPAP